MSKARISDVAKLAGVSASTVTRYIHNNGYVSPANKLKIATAIDSLGYLPNIQARSLRNKRSYTIGLLLSSERLNPFYTNIAHAIRIVAVQKGYSLLSTNHSFSPEGERNAVRQFIEYAVEAVIVCHALDPANMESLKRARIPIIQVERDRIVNTHLIEIDIKPGYDESILLLKSLGHRRIAFIGWLPRQEYLRLNASVTELKRIEGFREAIARHGLLAEHCPVLLGNDDKGIGPRVGRLLADRLLDGSTPPVTAVVTGSDVIACGVLQVLYQRRIRIPDDISVIGYDDSIAAFLTPALTSISQPYSMIADAAFDIISRLTVSGEGPIPIKVSVANKLTQRASVAPAP